jgi:D-cysteine desulfhydrase
MNDIEHVFVACGTGTTLAGICAGMQDFFPGTQVHGISVARDCAAEWPVLEEDMQILSRYMGRSYHLENMEFRDDFLCGGYGQYNEKLLDIIGQALRREGLITDPTYSGKALYGMSEMIAAEPKYRGSRILFWNTGGIFNLLSTKELWMENFKQDETCSLFRNFNLL